MATRWVNLLEHVPALACGQTATVFVCQTASLDGNEDNTDDCVMCQPASCGDGYTQDAIETCDDANDISTDDCIDCTAASGGDGYVQEGVEDCDDANADNADGCVAGCVAASCGDGYVQEGVESCDGNNLAGEDCQSQGFSGRQLSCTNDCAGFDDSMCIDDPCGGSGAFVSGYLASYQANGLTRSIWALKARKSCSPRGLHEHQPGSRLLHIRSPS